MILDTTLSICLLGEFSIRYKSNCLSDETIHSKKALQLLEYLITYRKKEISQAELIELLWPNDNSDNPVGALKTLLHRVRKILKTLEYPEDEPLIIKRRGAYAWNTSIDCFIDIEQFESYYKQGLHCNNSEKKLKLFQKGLTLYKGDYLPKSNMDPWAIPVHTYYHSLYLKMVHQTLKLLQQDSRYDEIATLTCKALSIDSYDEDLHYIHILSLYKSGNKKAALEHYQYATQLLLKNFGISPSKRFTSLYKEIQKSQKNTERNLTIIQQQLLEQREPSGAYFCEYSSFQDIYHLETRIAERTGETFYLCLLTLDGKYSDTLTTKTLNNAMDTLFECILYSLRKSDIFTRYSVNQFILMLPTPKYEYAELVLHRIMNNYSKRKHNSLVTLQYTITSITEKKDSE